MRGQATLSAKLLLVLLMCSESLALNALRRMPATALRRMPVVRVRVCLSADAGDDEEKGDSALDTDLLDSFRARLDEEGGATKLRLSSDAAKLSRALGGVKSVLDFDQSKSAPSVASREQWTLTKGFLAVVIALACFSALNAPPATDQLTPQQQAGRQVGGSNEIDTFTSDGGELMFGRR